MYQTCYGLSDRIIASIIGVHGDEEGLSLPPEVAPYQVVVVPIIFKEGAQEVLDFCAKLEEQLRSAGFRVRLDDRDLRAGKKFYEWEMRGVPLRIEIGPRDLKEGKMVLVRRDTREKEFVEYQAEELVELVEDRLGNITTHLREKAWEMLRENIREVKTLEEARDTIQENNGIVSFLWCGDEACGKDVEEKVHVDILGIQGDENTGKCVNCGKTARYRALLARTY